MLDNDDDIVLKGDKARVSEAMWNLLKNVIKFAERGRTISDGKKRDDNPLFTITVKDNGSGIGIEHSSKLSLSNSLQNLRKVLCY